MSQDVSEIAAGSPPANELEPYRRLIELQKEIVRLAEQNEHTRQNCLALRDQVAPRAPKPARPTPTLRQRVNRAVGQLPKFPAKSYLVSFVMKEESIC